MIESMQLIMNDAKLKTIEQVRLFLQGSQDLEFKPIHKEEKYHWVESVLKRFGYHRLSRKDKGTIRNYLIEVTGYSRAQVCRLIGEYREKGTIQARSYRRHRFPTRYTKADIELLARTDEWHGWLSGPATKRILEREWQIYGHAEYWNISGISVAHLYNLRRSTRYRELTRRYTKTRPAASKIGERAKPEPNGRPGHIRVDTVHQGDLNGTKGVYHINAVDEVTQWEIVVSVEGISEAYLIPALGSLLNQFPFPILGFHSDNGSEFINHNVVGLLNKLLIRLTKSRPRHSNDNALVESKNGSVIRKQLGYAHIPQQCAYLLNRYHQGFLNPYINFHRPCFFPVSVVDSKGKIRKRYPYQEVKTPYEKLKSLSHVEPPLRKGILFEMLDTIAYAMSDNQFAERMVKARFDLFEQIAKFANRVI
jgi:transposase InsO family protein